MSGASTGMACHIFAAANGPAARRAKPEASAAKLGSIDNGIWMCYRHGKLIDTDECAYTPELLTDWRRLAERRAALRHELGREPLSVDLSVEPMPTAEIELSSPEFVGQISETLEAGAVAIIWGDQNAMAVRDLIIELARNALTHGSAQKVKLAVKAHTIELSDDGSPFSLSALKEVGVPRGGALALQQALQLSPQVEVSYRRNNEQNIVDIGHIGAIDEMLSLNPCSTVLGVGMERVTEAMNFIEVRKECGTVFLRPHLGILSYSDLYNISNGIKARNLKDRDIVLVIEPHSKGVRKFIESEMPEVRIIETALRK
ncbi:hypothetical protein [Shimia sagamensis]|uniref:Uncharacterized protein n=1 Tax=Shimia sagamensis TaxID=1566352 RepID=A0ABY1PLC6_9RHOB|nr:hypothetical protein [Shimia sagamensis]SMP36408.1 hypothetical protein SAMN06265373_11611 [Shimia sagamensis]